MGIENLIKKLAAQPTTVEQHWAKQRAEWIDDLAALMRNIRAWLAPAVEQQLARIEPREVELDEPDTGPYEADALTIHLGDRKVAVEPRGMRIVGVMAAGGRRVVGASGRVDLVSGPARATLLRSADRAWRIASVDGWEPGRDAVALDAESFADTLAELIG